MIGFIVSSLLLVVCAYTLSTVTLTELAANVLLIGFWYALAATIHFFLNLILWKALVPHWTGHTVPRVLVQLTTGVVLLVVTGIVLVQVFTLPISGVITTSTVFVAIVGFALRNMISDLFTGIALGIEQPFSLGDWIQIADGTVGRVVEMNWRSTRLLTREEISVVIPNSELALSTFKNYSKPGLAWRDEFDILMDQAVTAHQAERILISAVRQVPEIVAVHKPTEVRISKYTENGIVWQVRYWVPDYPSMSALRYEVQKSVLRNMHYAGLAIPQNQIRVAREAEITQDGTYHFLRGIDLFHELSAEEIRQLEYTVRERLVRHGENVVEQGEPGESLFVIKEGLLKVNIMLENAQNIAVAHLVPGSFFGEMSLLTGDPRNATVSAQVDSLVFEVSKTDFEPILRARPELAHNLSQTVADRQSRNKHQSENLPAKEVIGSDTLRERIRRFFALSPEIPQAMESHH